ncbi:uncharacterized protein KQ657_000905 [Scheffersomyces spartinae]|uniref:L-2-hydroxyglutarate dehydrogenase, mitochondrial n=1 Tax=Scheffersomyces spartinae TaxID=45513 RepID=A0A9P7V855_9ASCO|nr:uncharacterized protein KQ657_000905 [Scheffersomyces spartinae]KAG7193151.1 hypothetical protein KQ657_000905 [Scheffersomyces spartinae]
MYVGSVRRADFSHVVIGGGIIGTAIASELQQVAGNLVLLVEQHEHLGTETTARNSEVIHAGIYYPQDSLKAKLCIEGKNKLYREFGTNSNSKNSKVPIHQCGKWVVAQSEAEAEHLYLLEARAKSLNVPVSFISPSEGKKQAPLIRASQLILQSPTTGIIDVHSLVVYFDGVFENAGGDVGILSKVVDISYSKGRKEYLLHLQDLVDDTFFSITSENVINSGGLNAPFISNMLLPPDRHIEPYFAKGNYYSYQPQTPINIAKDIGLKLIYPCPKPFASSLGTHLTFDLGGQIRFGPDIEWLNNKNIDTNDLDYMVLSDNLKPAYNTIKDYFPSLQLQDLEPSYSGIRPKLLSQEQSKNQFSDFVIREEEGFPGFVNLLGIESPGVTASWAIADYVKNIYHG